MDEASSVWFSDRSWRYLWVEVPRFENHPSLYYMILKAWREIAGSTEFDLRTPTAILSFGTVLMQYASGRIVGDLLGRNQGWALGLMAAAIAALSQFQIAFAGEARPYALACFGVSVMQAGALRIVCGGRRGEGARSAPGAAGLVLGMALTLWSHALGLLSAGLCGLFLIAWWLAATRADGRTFLRLAAMAALVALISLPHFQNMLAQTERDYSAFWIDAPSPKRLLQVTVTAVSLPGLPGGAMVQGGLAAVILPLGLLGLWRIGRADDAAGDDAPRIAVLGLLLLLSAGFWTVLVLYTFLVQPIFLPRTLIFMQPPILLILAAAPWAFRGRARIVLAAAMAGAAILAAAGPREVQIYDRNAEEIAVTIAAEAPDAPILALAGDSQFLLGYYEDRLGLDLDIIPVPAPFPHMRDGLPDFIERPRVDRDTADRFVADIGDAPVVWMMLRRSHAAESAVALRASLRASGREETVIIGDISRSHETLLRYDRPAAMAGEDP